ncbi:DUF3293 domain-containing protein [Niveibacterium sp. COAC-50]|uniref:DUF3293 domain-containing protein n=1 Tax=Niveibacterium sp. COAC-50 TaxID=2729384 RepID=UPI00155267E3|nr:DUF3293 domain-containing protein [Niveibacterium sp. COAC-50]
MIDAAASALPADLIQAYRAAHYRVLTAPPLLLRIDQPDPALANLLSGHGAKRAVLLTASNPASALLSDNDNAQRHTRLLDALAQRKLLALPACNESPKGDWPNEASVLVLHADIALGTELAMAFGQNAFVAIAYDATPRLVLLR